MFPSPAAQPGSSTEILNRNNLRVVTVLRSQMFFYIPTLSQRDDSAILRGQSPTRSTPPNVVRREIFKFPKLPGVEPGSAETPPIKSAILPTELPILTLQYKMMCLLIFSMLHSLHKFELLVE